MAKSGYIWFVVIYLVALLVGRLALVYWWGISWQ